MRRNIIAAISCILLVLVVFYSILAGLRPEAGIAALDKQIAATPEAAFVRNYFALLRKDDRPAVEALTDTKGVWKIETLFDLYQKIYPDKDPDSFKFFGEHTLQTPEYRRATLSQEAQFSDKWIVASVTIDKHDDTFRVVGFTLSPLNDSLEHLNRFEFFNQDAKHYWIFAISLCLLALNAYALIVWIKDPAFRFKWLWLIVLFIGMGKVEYNWLTGVAYYFGNYGKGYTIDVIKVPTVAYSLAVYQPFIITMSVPVGALLFLALHRKWPAPALETNAAAVPFSAAQP